MNYLTVKYVGHVIPVRELLIRIKENGGIDTEDLDIDFLESFISGNNSPQDLRNIHWELNESIVSWIPVNT